METHPTPEAIRKHDLITRKEAMAMLGLGETLLARLVRSGELKDVRIGRFKYLSRPAVEAYIARLASSVA